MKMKKNVSPCLRCVRVSDPENCTDKSCRAWQNWFLEAWERVRAIPRQQMDSPRQKVGVPLGGRHYAAPHQVDAYIKNDPCQGCMSPRQLCTAPCRSRKAWEKTVAEVGK